MKNTTFWIALTALMLSLGIIAILIMDVWEISVIDSNTFISAMVGIMTLVFTILIGYQIYNALDIKEKISEIDRLKVELQVAKDDLDKKIVTARTEIVELTREFQQGGYIMQARLAADKSSEQHYAFLKMMSALRYSLDVNHSDDGYGWMHKELRGYMLYLNAGYPFSGTMQDVRGLVQGYREAYREDDEAIRAHKNYFFIRDWYEPLMIEFEKRLNGIANMKPMSLTVVGEEQSE